MFFVRVLEALQSFKCSQDLTGALYIDWFVGMLLVGEGSQVDCFVRGPVAALLQGLEHRVVEVVRARVRAVVGEPASARHPRVEGDGAGVVRQHQAPVGFLRKGVN